MDIPRKSQARKRKIKRIFYAASAIAAVSLITFGVSRLKPADPSVDKGTIWMDTVKRGEMLRQVRGLGTLVPEEILWVTAATEGRVERILVKPGDHVTPTSILLHLSNPELEQTLLEADQNLKGAVAEYSSLRVRLERELLDQRAQAATVKADFSQARLQAEVNEILFKQGLISDINFKVSKVRAEELSTRNEIEGRRLEISAESVRAQLAVQQARVDQFRALAQLRRDQVDQLRIRAGTSGVVQQVPVEVGQRVTSATNLARVANPESLKAELRIAETQAPNVLLGQRVQVDTRNGIIPGIVARIDPAAVNGTVTVDVTLQGELPRGARPDLSVDGTIELERLENVLYVGRPVHGQEGAVVGLFKLGDDGTTASRVQVRLGKASVSTIEILEGLSEGDQVVLSDTSAWDNVDRIRIK